MTLDSLTLVCLIVGCLTLDHLTLGDLTLRLLSLNFELSLASSSRPRHVWFVSAGVQLEVV